MSIITLSDYKEYAGIKSPDNDIKLQAIVDFSNTYIRNYCNNYFKDTSVTAEAQTCFNGEYIILDKAFASSIEEIRVFGEPLAPDDYILLKDEGIVEFRDHVNIPSNRFAIEVDYTCGISEIPADLRLAALEFVTHMYKREFNKSINMGGESATYSDPKNIPNHILLALNMYKVS